MYLSRLELTQYRNYHQLSIHFDDKINLLIGDNAQGKTNLLESIYVLAMAKSHRTSNDKELIQWEEKFTRVEGTIQKRQQAIPLELQISLSGKKAKANHLEQKKLSSYIGHMNIVMFAPEDLNLVKGMPQIRRRFLDMEIGQVSPIYLHEMNQYQKILQQRNAELKRVHFLQNQNHSILDILTEQLMASAIKILTKRFEFLEMLSKRAIPLHRDISHQLEKLEIQYQSSIDVSETTDLEKIIAHFEGKFVKIRGREIERGTTLIGPHRDDLIFYLNGQNVQRFGSQGQQRTTALSLKLAEIELIHDEIGEYPILLLDDVLSELDDARQTHLLNAIQGKVQTFITTTSVDGIEHESLQQAAHFEVTNGAVQTK